MNPIGWTKWEKLGVSPEGEQGHLFSKCISSLEDGCTSKPPGRNYWTGIFIFILTSFVGPSWGEAEA